MPVHFRSRRVAALRVAEDERIVEAEPLDGVDAGLEILLGLAREADDDVGGDGQVRPGGFHFLADLDESGVLVGSPHFAQDPVRSALHREMDVRAELRQIGERGDEVVPVADGMR